MFLLLLSWGILSAILGYLGFWKLWLVFGLSILAFSLIPLISYQIEISGASPGQPDDGHGIGTALFTVFAAVGNAVGVIVFAIAFLIGFMGRKSELG